MAYHSTLYLLAFLPIVLLLYQIVPQRWRWSLLLGASYFYFWSFSGVLVLYLAGTTLFVAGIGRCLHRMKLRCKEEAKTLERAERSQYKKRCHRRERQLLTVSIIVLVGVLGYLKYANFLIENTNSLLAALHIQVSMATRKIMVPIGVSFYTLEAIGYLVDVYWEKIPGNEPLGKVALFLGFFPQTMEGPIAMYEQTADDIWAGKPLKLQQLGDGAVRIFWGLFKKIIIADRLAVAANELFDHFTDYHGVMIVVAAVFYTVQLYMEFSGCMDIVIGSGQLFGICLPENFNQPFVSRNPAEFWRRWHMSLGVWFRTYIFYPVSTSGLVKKWTKFARKKLGKQASKVGVSALALFPVWMCNGLWHGASWNYIFYGVYYFVLLLGSVILEPVRERVLQVTGADETAAYWKVSQILKTWVIIVTGELFFRANGIRAGLIMFTSMFRSFSLSPLCDGSLLALGLEWTDYVIVAAGCLAVAVVGSIREHQRLGGRRLLELPRPIGWGLCLALILSVVIFGAYGVGYQQVDLIYAGF
ncbi:MAG: MBOAT family O-acyltransferase [Lachnospiraceae bacterium]|nr:MBOAT family O-acyltransferase [Lachnospiraceae bacterium]